MNEYMTRHAEHSDDECCIVCVPIHRMNRDMVSEEPNRWRCDYDDHFPKWVVLFLYFLGVFMGWLVL
ncbi:hypothetical protein LCGC14_2580770 [marine sediment metagenome]|uniref:Uncharacterized protein n=1 Tax=marine sediment metagenome TaxID=412755 RepID=A0A0F9D787_9ZZZZ